VSAYVREDRRGAGAGRALYTELLDELRRRRYVTALAGIALPNPGSVVFHEAFGFQHVGTFPQVGFKLGAWRDVGWWALSLAPPPPDPTPPGRRAGAR
jgi:phosphinothricin acetyltransferase